MNIKDGDVGRESIAAAQISAAKGGSSKRRQKRGNRADGRGSGRPAADSLEKDSDRLLATLGQAEASAFVDPTDPASVLVHRRRSGISVGAGRFALAAAEALVRSDLACWSGPPSSRRNLRLTDAGKARLRRRLAPDEDLAFFGQHHAIDTVMIETEGGPARVRVDAEESPLDWLRRRKDRKGEPMIDEASYQAGERLRTDIMLAGLLPGVTARWDGMPGGGPSSPGEATDRMVAARQRLRHAFDAIGGDFSDLLLDLCGFLKGLEQIERERQWPPRSAKVVVRLALARLAEHYGIEPAACGPAASRGIRAWQAVVIDGGKS